MGGCVIIRMMKNRVNQILLGLVIILVLALVGILVWQRWMKEPSYYAVFVRTGDLYFGRLAYFPHFGLKGVYLIQVNSQNQQNPFSVQKFSNIFWGPEDYLRINREEVVWIAKLRPDSQLAQFIKSNPSLGAQTPLPTTP